MTPGHQECLKQVGKTILALSNRVVCLHHEVLWHLLPTLHADAVHRLDCAAQDLQEPVCAMIDALTGEVCATLGVLRLLPDPQVGCPYLTVLTPKSTIGRARDVSRCSEAWTPGLESQDY